MTEWYENESFWRDTRDVIFNAERIRQAAEEAEQVASLVELAPDAAVLDMGCGVGRHAIELARRGCRVTGVDLSDHLLEQARRTAAEEKLDIEWVREDMRRFRRADDFDVVVSLLTSFGVFADPADDFRAAENMNAALKPGGQLVIDMMGKEVLSRIYRSRDWHQQLDGTILLEEREVTDGWQWLTVRWIVISGERIREHRFGLRLYSAAELSSLLSRAGFVDMKIYGSLAGADYDEKAERLVVVARKREAAH